MSLSPPSSPANSSPPPPPPPMETVQNESLSPSAPYSPTMYTSPGAFSSSSSASALQQQQRHVSGVSYDDAQNVDDSDAVFDDATSLVHDYDGGQHHLDGRGSSLFSDSGSGNGREDGSGSSSSISSSASTLSLRASLDNLRLASSMNSSAATSTTDKNGNKQKGTSRIMFRSGGFSLKRNKSKQQSQLQSQRHDGAEATDDVEMTDGHHGHGGGGDGDHHIPDDAPDRWKGYSLGTAPKSVIWGAIVNLANCIATAGLCGIPYALAHSGGVLFGPLFAILFVIVSDISLRSLVEAGVHFNALSYGSVCKRALGKNWELVQRISVLLFAIGTMANYLIIVRDTIPDTIDYPVRILILLVITVTIVLPLCSCRSLEALSKTSLLALMVAGAVVCALFVHLLTGDPPAKGLDDVSNPPTHELSIAAMGAVAFAYVAHHTSFHLFGPIYTNTPYRNQHYAMKGWSITSHLGLSWCTLLFLLESVFAILLFGRDDIKDNILLHGEVFSLPFRIIIVIPMLLTFPVEGIVARDTIHSMIMNPLLKKRSSGKARAFVGFVQNHALLVRVLEASGMIFIVFCIAVAVQKLALIQNITGGVAASMLGFILPGMCVYKMGDRKIKGIAIAAFGWIILTCALLGEALNLINGHE
eukprot:ANDGO_00356.mRNA.1 Vacuolar amino acid transporter 2